MPYKDPADKRANERKRYASRRELESLRKSRYRQEHPEKSKLADAEIRRKRGIATWGSPEHLEKLRAARTRQIANQPTPVERFWAKVEKTNTCWNWTAARSKGGYGTFQVNGTKVWAHRFAHEIATGPIPAGFAVDHLCYNPLCVNPSHLEAVEPGENSRRAAARRAGMKAAKC